MNNGTSYCANSAVGGGPFGQGDVLAKRKGTCFLILRHYWRFQEATLAFQDHTEHYYLSTAGAFRTIHLFSFVARRRWRKDQKMNLCGRCRACEIPKKPKNVSGETANKNDSGAIRNVVDRALPGVVLIVLEPERQSKSEQDIMPSERRSFAPFTNGPRVNTHDTTFYLYCHYQDSGRASSYSK